MLTNHSGLELSAVFGADLLLWWHEGTHLATLERHSMQNQPLPMVHIVLHLYMIFINQMQEG